MATITGLLSAEHTRCDTLFAQAEEAAARHNWQPASDQFEEFVEATEGHFAKEEQVLFPAFEAHTGMREGPTAVMRLEHQQMRKLFEEMRESLQQQDFDEYLGLAETLLMLMRQHNAKEEQVLYPMSDQALADDLQGLLGKLRAP